MADETLHATCSARCQQSYDFAVGAVRLFSYINYLANDRNSDCCTLVERVAKIQLGARTTGLSAEVTPMNPTLKKALRWTAIGLGGGVVIVFLALAFMD